MLKHTHTITMTCFLLVYGRDSCGYTQKALSLVQNHKILHQYRQRSEMAPAHEKQLTEYNHYTVPAIFLQCKPGQRYLFIGGYDEFLSFLKIFGSLCDQPGSIK